MKDQETKFRLLWTSQELNAYLLERMHCEKILWGWVTIILQHTFSQLLWGLIFLLCIAVNEDVTSYSTPATDHLKFQNVGCKPVISVLLSLPLHQSKKGENNAP